MNLLRMLNRPKYLVISGLASAGFALLYIWTQVLGNFANIDVWFAAAPLENITTFFAFVLLFGITLGYQLFVRLEGAKACPIAKPTTASGFATFTSFLVTQCPACASIGVLFLPASVVAFIGQYGIWINLATIAVLLFTLNYLGAFRRS